jgi:hypothetical protein
LKTTLLIAALSLFMSLPSFAQEQFDVVAACKKDCPKAKNNEDAHKCAEKKGRLNKEFRKSQCWEVNEKYEATQAKEKGSGESAEKDTH